MQEMCQNRRSTSRAQKSCGLWLSSLVHRFVALWTYRRNILPHGTAECLVDEGQRSHALMTTTMGQGWGCLRPEPLGPPCHALP
jgi:hypothetical protein